MSTIYQLHPDVARHEIARRLRAADEDRRRRLARHHFRSARRAHASAFVAAMWR